MELDFEDVLLGDTEIWKELFMKLQIPLTTFSDMKQEANEIISKSPELHLCFASNTLRDRILARIRVDSSVEWVWKDIKDTILFRIQNDDTERVESTDHLPVVIHERTPPRRINGLAFNIEEYFNELVNVGGVDSPGNVLLYSDVMDSTQSFLQKYVSSINIQLSP